MAFSKLLGRDAQEVTPAQAGAWFAEEAKRIALKQNIDLAKAWQIAKKLHPEAHARLCEGAQPTVTMANAAMQPIGIPSVANLKKLGLPPDASYEEWITAYRANGNETEKRASAVIFNALKKLVGGATEEIARKRTAERFPVLAKDLEMDLGK